MSWPLSHFETTGIAFPIPVLDADELRIARDEYAKLVAAHDGTLTRLDRVHLYFDWAYDLTVHPRIVDTVASLIGDDIIVWGTLLLSKPPRDDEFVAWHQDGAYASFLGEAQSVSAWVALSDSTSESGCMRVIPGSQKTRHDHVEAHRPENMLSRGQEIAVDVDETEAVNVELRAGEMSVHHLDIIHGSGPNRSSWRRTGFIIRYATPRMLQAPTRITVARGRGAEHLDTLHTRPHRPFHEALAAHQTGGS
jgi:ectoine hydroxylase-related dioxygenase (phytanoyl-CoA dioxygenase family)